MNKPFQVSRSSSINVRISNLDRIEYNVEHSNMNVQSAQSELEKADESHAKSRKRYLFCFLFCFMIFAILLIALILAIVS